VAQTRFVKPFAVLLLLALAFAAAAVSVATGGGAEPSSPRSARALDGELGAGKVSRAAAATVEWRGGPTVTSTGETVTVYVSQALPVESEPAGGWAEFIAKLTHGPEIAQLRAYIATFAEVQQACGSRALGCYGGNEMISLGEPAFDGTTAEEVVRHEYGHHVAYHRANTPWQAIQWGPKNWASAANVCARQARNEVFPGASGQNYALNPGEAWAEVYRLMDERKAGVTTQTWSIISRSFFPTEAALLAAERDVVQPWTRTTVTSAARVFGKRTPKTWRVPVTSSLDGELRVTATLPRTGEYEVALVAGNGRVIRRAQWVSQRVKRLTTTICGQRSLAVRVALKGGALGRVAVSVSAP
jgi:hypothetical protein